MKKGLLYILLLLALSAGTACSDKSKAQMTAYKDMMDSLLENGILTVGGKNYTYDMWKKTLTEHPDYNSFAIADVDGDGSEELIISFEGLSAAENKMYVFDYNESKGLYCETEFFYKDTRFYRDCAIVNSAKNQGPTGELWPYAVYKYNSEDDGYSFVCYVDAYDSKYFDLFPGWVFPQEYDLDNDGIVYRLHFANTDDIKTLDNAEYVKWRESIVDESTKKDLEFIKITSENVEDAF